MRCKDCGKKVRAGSSYCPYCSGTDLLEDSKASGFYTDPPIFGIQKRVNRKQYVFMAVCLGIGAFFILLGLLFLANTHSEVTLARLELAMAGNILIMILGITGWLSTIKRLNDIDEENKQINASDIFRFRRWSVLKICFYEESSKEEFGKREGKFYYWRIAFFLAALPLAYCVLCIVLI